MSTWTENYSKKKEKKRQNPNDLHKLWSHSPVDILITFFQLVIFNESVQINQ